MSPEAVLAVTGTVLILVEIAKASRLPKRWGPLAAAVFSAIGVGVWAYSNGGMPQSSAFSFLTAWANITLQAIGAFEIIKRAFNGMRARNSGDDA